MTKGQAVYVESIGAGANLIGYTRGYAVTASTARITTPAADTAGTITLAAGSGVYNVIGQVYYSYSASPTGGSVVIKDGTADVVFNADVIASGPGCFTFDPPMKATATNKVMSVVLAAGGESVAGKLMVVSWTEA